MPIIKPKLHEPKPEFISRCMSDDELVKEFPDNKQRVAVCYSFWNRKNENRNESDGWEKFRLY